jgi:two-component SAPR family response regulator
MKGPMKFAWREFDPVSAERELRARLPELQAALKRLEAAKVVTWRTLELRFTV